MTIGSFGSIALPAGLSAILLAGSAVLVMRRLGPRTRPWVGPLGQHGGASIIDFMVTMPLVLIFSGLIVQYGLMTHGLLVVYQAAYFAARSASVYVPAYYPEDGQTHPAALGTLGSLLQFTNLGEGFHVDPAAGGADAPFTVGPVKLERIKAAAAVACLPVAADFPFVPGYVSGSLTGLDSLGLHNFLSRLIYAWKYTSIDFSLWDINGAALSKSDFASAFMLKSWVHFGFPLKVPFARRLLANKVTGPYAWRPESLLGKLLSFGGIAKKGAPPGTDYVSGVLGLWGSTGKYYTELVGSWVFYRENGYYRTTPSKVSDFFGSPDRMKLFQSQSSKAEGDPKNHDPNLEKKGYEKLDEGTKQWNDGAAKRNQDSQKNWQDAETERINSESDMKKTEADQKANAADIAKNNKDLAQARIKEGNDSQIDANTKSISDPQALQDANKPYVESNEKLAADYPDALKGVAALEQRGRELDAETKRLADEHAHEVTRHDTATSVQAQVKNQMQSNGELDSAVTGTNTSPRPDVTPPAANSSDTGNSQSDLNSCW